MVAPCSSPLRSSAKHGGYLELWPTPMFSSLLLLLLLLSDYCNLFLSKFRSGVERLGYSEEKILASKFHLLEEKSRNTVMLMVSSWNSGVNALKSLCKGKDWILYLKDFHLPL
ncbi:hypothetical protein V6N12_062790 [Hibiscus sabdariffa]|uniref:Uncharacterized protein n=1 Tax=Hibiscus sabdariffa TaxID=183260 RepID=A0ABR2F9Z6_9ROSI